MTERPSTDDLARLIAKRPGMYIGEASYERAVGLLTGLASIASTLNPSAPAPVAPDEFSVGNGSDLLRRIAALRRDPDIDEREAILALEPLLAEALAELQARHEA